jgi:hypothetical protein
MRHRAQVLHRNSEQLAYRPPATFSMRVCDRRRITALRSLHARAKVMPADSAVRPFACCGHFSRNSAQIDAVRSRAPEASALIVRRGPVRRRTQYVRFQTRRCRGENRRLRKGRRGECGRGVVMRRASMDARSLATR